MIVRFLASAQADLDGIYVNVAIDNVDAADRLVDRLRRSTRRLADFPRSAPSRPDVAASARGLSVVGHVILYRIIADEVHVVRVIRASQDMTAIDF